MRVVGVDLGRSRVGVAVSDDGERVATAHTVLHRSGDERVDRQALLDVVHLLGAGRVVVGLPLSLDGSVGRAARWATEEADQLRAALAVPVELHDERLTTVTALRGSAKRGGRRSRRTPVDGQAAAVMLQSWLDGHHTRGEGPDR